MEVNDTTKKFKVTKEVGHFRVGTKKYKPGEIVELADEFPAHLYSFLQPIGKPPSPPQKVEARIGTPVPVPVGQPLKTRRGP